MSLLFSKVDYFSTPANIFPDDEKVNSGKQIGAIKPDDNKSLAIFEVKVDDSIRIDQNIKNFAIRLIFRWTTVGFPIISVGLYLNDYNRQNDYCKNMEKHLILRIHEIFYVSGNG